MIYEIPIAMLRPNNWYLCRRKVDVIREVWDRGESGSLPPVLVVSIDGEWSLIDGHSRVFVAFEMGVSRIRAEVRTLPEIEGPSELYEWIHRAGPGQGVCSFEELRGRLLSEQEYRVRWVEFCRDKARELGVP
jgi:hypothetical protein